MKKDKVEVIWGNAVYIIELKMSYLLELYYLIFEKDYLEEKNT